MRSYLSRSQLTLCVITIAVGSLFASAAQTAQAELRWPYKIFGHKGKPTPRKVRPLTNAQKLSLHGVGKVSPFADYSNTSNDWGYYMGGGNPYARNGRFWRPEPRHVQCEGVWGWDYAQPWSRVRLRWWHGRQYQDGEGQYTQDNIVNPFRPSFGP